MAEKETAKNALEQRDESGRFVPGNPGGPGRPQGEPNRINALLKDDILEAYRQRGALSG